MELTTCSASHAADAFLARELDYPGQYHGRGLVICGGGIKYGTCVWVLVRMLRRLGCQLPIEVWSLSDDEYDPQWIELLGQYGVNCIDSQAILRRHPHRRLRGWELKPYAIKHSRFREVLFLDADNVPVRDPSFLFDTPEYQATGTVFWPDPAKFKTASTSPRWKVFGLPYRESPDQESGQLLIDKARCWKALCLCNWYNEHSDFYYQHVYGDKETFRFAWQRLDQPIHWIQKPPHENVRFTLCQHDLEGEVLFQHRFFRKWQLYGDNVHVEGFQHESRCLEFVDELRQQWQPQRHLMRRLREEDVARIGEYAGRCFLYDRPGHNRWPIRLAQDGRVSEGYGPNEFFWWFERGFLTLVGSDGRRRCRLRPKGVGWHGVRRGRVPMEIRLNPLAA